MIRVCLQKSGRLQAGTRHELTDDQWQQSAMERHSPPCSWSPATGTARHARAGSGSGSGCTITSKFDTTYIQSIFTYQTWM